MASVRQATFESGLLQNADAFNFENGAASLGIESASPIVGSHSFKLTAAGNNSYGQITVSTVTLSIAMYFRLDDAPTDLTRIIWVSDGGITRRWSVQLNADRTLQLRRITTLSAGVSAPLTVGTTYRIEVQNDATLGMSLWLAEGDGESALVATMSANTGGTGHLRIGAVDGNEASLDATIDEIYVNNDTTIPELPSLSAPLPTFSNVDVIRRATFEDGSLTGSKGYESVAGTVGTQMILDDTNVISGEYSARISATGTTVYGQMVDYPLTRPDQSALSFYMQFNGPIPTTYIIATFMSSGSQTQISFRLNSDGKFFLGFSNTATLVGKVSDAVVEQGKVYRVDMMMRNASHVDGEWRYCAVTDMETDVTDVLANEAGADGSITDVRYVRVPVGSFWSNDPLLVIDTAYLSDSDKVPMLPGIVAPTGEGIEYLNPTDARIFWSALTGARRYGVEWSDDGGETWTVIDDILDLFWIHVGRTLGGSYLYRIKAVVETGPDPEDEEETGYTEPIEDTAPETILDTPANSAAGSPTHNSVDVSWDAVTGATGYDIRYSTDETNWTIVEGVTSPHTQSGLQPETTYYFQTRSENDTGLSEWSTSVSATTEAAPSGATSNHSSIRIGIHVGV